jgi:uncharacterized membrane protein
VSTTTTTDAPAAAPRRRPSTWPVPLALVALSLIPVVAGALRVTDVTTGSTFMPEDAHHPAVPLALVVHIVSAVAYSLVGAFQFSAGLRRRRPRWHRAAGRVLVPMGLAVAGSALWMTLGYPREVHTGPLLFWSRLAFGTGMILCLVLGLRAILRRNVPTHRAWMIRAYALGLGAGTQVVTIGFGQALFGTSTVVTDAVTAVGWAINLTLAELVIRMPRTRSRVTSPLSTQHVPTTRRTLHDHR